MGIDWGLFREHNAGHERERDQPRRDSSQNAGSSGRENIRNSLCDLDFDMDDHGHSDGLNDYQVIMPPKRNRIYA
jgi:hypothetical protein